MIDLKDIHSLTEFQRNVKRYVRHMKKTKSPLVLTVNGKAELVVQDAESYQQILDRLVEAEAVESTRKGMMEFDRGEGRSALKALDGLRQKHDVPR